MRGFRKNHPEWAEYNRNYSRQWRQQAENRVIDSQYRKKYRTDPSRAERIRELGRQSNRHQKYGLTDEQYDKLMEEHEYKCAICFATEVLCVDHCHETGKVRGVLCARCNSGIGFLRDSTLLAKRAYEYLEERQ
jgi:DNA-directed RNA polymerase subunit RPC12/RpoP